MQNKKILLILVILVVIAIGAVAYMQMNKDTSQSSVQQSSYNIQESNSSDTYTNMRQDKIEDTMSASANDKDALNKDLDSALELLE